jgi:hypothetical protein
MPFAVPGFRNAVTLKPQFTDGWLAAELNGIVFAAGQFEIAGTDGINVDGHRCAVLFSFSCWFWDLVAR